MLNELFNEPHNGPLNGPHNGPLNGPHNGPPIGSPKDPFNIPLIGPLMNYFNRQIFLGKKIPWTPTPPDGS